MREQKSLFTHSCLQYSKSDFKRNKQRLRCLFMSGNEYGRILRACACVHSCNNCLYMALSPGKISAPMITEFLENPFPGWRMSSASTMLAQWWALAGHQYGLCSIPDSMPYVGWVCFVLYSDLRYFSASCSVFPLSSKAESCFDLFWFRLICSLLD